VALDHESQRHTTRTHTRSTLRIRRAVVAGLALIVAGLAGLASLSSIATARQQQEIQGLQTLAAQDGALVATLMAASPTLASATPTPSPTPVPPTETTRATATDDETLLAEETAPATEATLTATATASDPPTATAQPTAKPTSTAIAGSAMIFADDFSNDDGGWEVGNAGDVTRAIEDGQLRFFVNTDYALWASRPEDLDPQGDMIFSADVEVLEGEGDFSYGLIFRQVDFDNYYYFLLNNQGEILALKQLDGVGSFLVQPTRIDEEIMLPGKSEMRLTVIAIGPEFTFFVDGQQVAQARDAAVGSGTLGVAVQTLGDFPIHVAFDNVVVQAP
jgi:hypothetical protein